MVIEISIINENKVERRAQIKKRRALIVGRRISVDYFILSINDVNRMRVQSFENFERYNDVCIFNDCGYNDVVAWQVRFFSIREVSMLSLRTIMSFKFYDASDLCTF